MQVVLKRGACQQKPMLGLELTKGFSEYALVILDTLGFIHNHEVVVDFTEDLLLLQNHLISSQQDIKVSAAKLGQFEIFSVLDVAIEH